VSRMVMYGVDIATGMRWELSGQGHSVTSRRSSDLSQMLKCDSTEWLKSYGPNHNAAARQSHNH